MLCIACLLPAAEAFRYDFDLDEERYTSDSDDAYVIARKKESMVFHNNSTSFKWTGYDEKLRTDTPFAIEMKMKVVEGNALFGFGFDYRDSENFDFIRMNKSGDIYAEYREGGKYKVRFTDSIESVNPAGWNLLRVEYDGNEKLDYLLNGKLIQSIDYQPRRGKYVVITAEKGAKVEVDYFAGWHEPDTIINLVSKSWTEEDFKITKLPPQINHEGYSQRIDFVSPDNNTLYISVREHPKNKGGIEDKEEIWFAERQQDGKWGETYPAPDSLNIEGWTWTISVSPDGNLIRTTKYIDPTTREVYNDGYSESRKKEDGSWTFPNSTRVKGLETNSGWINYSISSDGQYLLFSGEIEDNNGNDLWVMKKLENGEWSERINLGPDINTIFDEAKPHLAGDNKTLYFYSEGIPNYGKGDMFVTRRLDDSWQKWTKPQNLGPYLNSEYSDWGLILTASGEFGYINRYNKDGFQEIYEFIMPVEARPEALLTLQGRVLDNETKKPILADIIYNDMSSGEVMGRGLSGAQDGRYKVILPAGRAYGISAEQKGYYSVTVSANTAGLERGAVVSQDILMQPIREGSALRLNNLFFDTGEWNLKPESKHELDRVIKLIKEYPGYKFQIEGHTDNVGSDESNQTLSENRAKSVFDYLIINGISKDKISFKGFGESSPIDDNESEAGRQMNRRVELRVLGK